MRSTIAIPLLLLALSLASCDREPASVAGWETYTTPTFDSLAPDAKPIGALTVWHRDNVEYWDQDQDGVIDTKVEEASMGRQITWQDTNRDGVFDVETVMINGGVDPTKDVRAISVPVPKTK